MQKERKTIVKLIDNNKIYNHKLVEFFAKRISEKGIDR